jgi:hypothetical protein
MTASAAVLSARLVSAGSPLAYRLLGFMTKRVPYAVRVFAAADDDDDGAATRLTAEAFSDAGPYLVKTGLAARTYAEQISATLSELQRR